MDNKHNEYDMEHDNGQTFKMGADINNCGPGDAVKIGGQLKIIKSISRCGKWDRDIKTTDGCNYGMMQVRAYGKKKENGK